MNELDYELAIMEMWKGDNSLKLQGVSRIADAIFTSMELTKNCMVPTKDEIKTMTNIHNQGLMNFFQGKTFSESDAIKGYLKIAN